MPSYKYKNTRCLNTRLAVGHEVTNIASRNKIKYQIKDIML